MTGFDNDSSERSLDEFEKFARVSEERLRIALTASFGVTDGRIAAVDALSWAWENWDRVKKMSNPVGYLYRVGQTSARRIRPRPISATLEMTSAETALRSPCPRSSDPPA